MPTSRSSAGKHLLALINDVLDLSKIEAEKMEVHLETFEVSPMLQEVVATITPLVAKNGNQLEVRCAEGLETLHADLTKVRQALFNLLSNACKFTSGGVITLAVAKPDRMGEPGKDAIHARLPASKVTPVMIMRVFMGYFLCCPRR